MVFTGWRKWLNRLSAGSGNSKRGRARRQRGRLGLETLEQRLTPTVRTWSGASGIDTFWSDARNWQGNVAPLPGKDSLLFPISATKYTSQNDFAQGTDFQAITFAGGGYTLTGNPMQLGNLAGIGSVTDNSGATTNTINLNMQFFGLSGSETFTISPNTVLTIGGKLSGQSGIQLQKRNSGTLILNNDNSALTGPITVSQGALEIQNARALGSNNTTAVLSGATLQLFNVVGNIDETLILSGTGISNTGALENLSGNNTVTGSITFGASVMMAAESGQMTLGGVLGDNGIGYTVTFGNVDPTQQGTVILSNANTYVGPTVVNNGALLITNPLALGTTAHGATVNDGASLELQGVSVTDETLQLTGLGVSSGGALRNVSGPNDFWTGKISLAGTAAIGADTGSKLTVTGKISEGTAGSGLTKEGNGTVVLTTANTYTGVTTVQQGILNIQDPFALGGSAAAGVVVVGRATLQTQVSVLNEKLTLNGPGVNNTGALDNVTGSNVWSGNVFLPTDASVGAEANTQIKLTGVISGNGGLTKYGPGEAVLTNANIYLGSTDVNAGVLTIQNSTALGVFPVGSTLEASTTVERGAALDIDGQGGSLTITDPLILAGTGINNTGAVRNISGTNLMTGLVLLTGNTGIGVDAGVSQLTMNNDFSERLPGGYGITKVGPNRLILSGFNRYTGPDEVKQGTLTAASDNALGTTDAGTTVDNGAVLEIQGGVEIGNEALKVTGNGINNSGAVLSVSDDNRYDGDVTFTGNVGIGVGLNSRLAMRGNFSDGQNGFSLTKTGGGKLTLGGTNSYGGGTSIQAGIVNIQSNSALGADVAGTIVQAGASLELQDNVVLGAQKLTVSGTGPSTAQNIPARWFPFGPAAINNVAGGLGNPTEGSGRITAIAADQSNPGVYYIGAASGGVWKTKNGGINWIPVTDNLPAMFIGAIAVSASNPNVIYAGTGEDNDATVQFGFGADAMGYGNGVLRSTDGGVTWTLLGSNHFFRQDISKVIIDPKNPNIVYVATGAESINAADFPVTTPIDLTGTGIWKSTDGGATWKNTTFNPFIGQFDDNYTDLVMDPLDHNHLIAAIGGDWVVGGTVFFNGDNGLYESFNAGGSWGLVANFPHDLGGPLTGGTTAVHNDGWIKLAIAPFIPDIPLVYASVSDVSESWSLKHFEVDDSGGLIGFGAWSDVKDSKFDYLGGQGFYDNVVAVSPNDPLNIFAGGQVGATGGVVQGHFDPVAVKMTWSDISVGTDGNGPHTDHHAMAFDSFGKLLDGNDGGIWRLADPTKILWQNLNSNLAITQLYSVTVAPNNPNIALAGAQDNGTFQFSGNYYRRNAGWNEVFGGDGGITILDPNNTNTVYGQVNSTPIRSDDGGATWNPITNGFGTSDPINFPYFPMVLDPSSSHRLLAGTNSVYETTDQGNNWTALSIPNLNGWESTATIDSIGLSASNANVIYANAGGDIFVTQDHGKKWTKSDVKNGGVTVNDHFGNITVDPNVPGTAYIVRNVFNLGGAKGHVFQTTNFGASWIDITGNLPEVPTWTLLIDPRPNPHILYVGTDNGVYASTNLGQSWAKFGVGMPNVQVRTLILDPLKDYIVAGTLGRGAFIVELDSPAGKAGGIRAITGTNTWGGDITIPADSYVGADIGSVLTLSGFLTDSQTGSGLTKVGPGTVVINNVNSYSGATTVNDGILEVQNSRAMGTGTQVTVDGGTLELNGDGLSFSQQLTLNGSGFNSIGALLNTGGNNFWTGNVSLASNSSIGADPGTVLTITGIMADSGLQFGIAKVGMGELVLTATNTYGGDTNILAGDIGIQNVFALGNGLGTTVVSNGASLFLEFPTDGNTYTVSGEKLKLQGSGIGGLGALRDISGIDGWAGNIILLTNSAMGVDDVKSPLTISGVISDNASNSALSKEGDGRLILQNKDTYSGGTTVDSGYLNIQNSQALGANTVGTVVNNGGALELEVSVPLQPLVLNGNGPTGDGSLVDVVGNDTWGGPINLASSSTMGVENDALGMPLRLTIVGDITGLESSVLTKVGPGTLVFPTSNHYFGQTLVAVGILDIQDSQALGALGGDGTFVQRGATLQIEKNVTVIGKTLGLTGAGVNGKGALENLNGANTWQGSIILIGDATIAVDNAGDTLTANRVITETVAGSSLTKIGAGAMVISGPVGFDNTYTGSTNVVSGALVLSKTGGAIAVPANLTIGTGAAGNSASVLFQGDQELAATSVVTVNSDGIYNQNSHIQTIGGMQITDGTALTGATGVLTINGPLSMTGGLLSIGGPTSKVVLGGTVSGKSDGPALIISAGGTLSLGGSTRTFIMTKGTGPVDMVISAPITGTGSEGLTLAAPAGPAQAGVLQLAAAEAYTGATTVSGGTLLVDGSAGNVTVSGGILGGLGTVGTVTANSGSIFPGSPSGAANTLTTTGNVSMAANSSYVVQLNSLAANNLLNITGNLSLGNAGLTGNLASGFSPPIGSAPFTIISWTGTLTGQFRFGTTALIGGLPFTVTYGANSISLTRIAAQSVFTALSAVTSTGNSAVFGQPITFQATVGPVAPVTAIPTGSVVFTIDSGTLGQIQATRPIDPATGNASFTISTLSVGTHTFSTSYAGDSNFLGSTDPVSGPSPTVVVNKADTTTATTTGTPGSVVFSQNFTLQTTITANPPGAGNPTGTVTFKSDGQLVGTAPVNTTTGVASLTTSTLPAGTHTITASYSGDVDFNISTSSSTLTVNPAGSTTAAVSASLTSAVYAQPITFSTSVSPQSPATAIPTGTVNFLEGSNVIGTGTVDSGGNASFVETTQLTPGVHSITVAYIGDGNFSPSSNSTAVTVTISQDGTTTTVTASANPSVFSQPVTFTATLLSNGPSTGIPTGQVTFTVDSTVEPAVTLDGNGQATFTISTLSGGTHTVSVSYGGNANYAQSSATLAPVQQVNKAGTTASLVSSVNSPVFGQNFTFTATIAAAFPATGIPTGQVTFTLDSNPSTTAPLDNSGKAIFAAAGLSVGQHTLSVSYAGDTNFGTSNKSLSVTVGVASTATAAPTVSPTSPVFGQPVTITTTVTAQLPGSGTPGGTVTFLDNGSPIGTASLSSGSASITTTAAIAVGPHAITVSYAGDGNFAGSTSAATSLTVLKADAATVVTASSASPSVFGQAVTFTASVSAVPPGAGVPAGIVTFVDGSTTLGTGSLNSSGVATFTTTIALAVGSHNITASYGGNGSFNPSAVSATFVQIVNKADTTTGAASAAPSSPVFGQAVTFTVTISPNNPGAGTLSGTVTFTDGATTLGTGAVSGGRASFTTSSVLAVGPHTIVATYSGDGSFKGSTSSATVTVGQASANVAVASTVNPSVFGQPITLTATVAAQLPGVGTPSGSVTFTVDSTSTTVALDASAKATFVISSLGTGSHSVNVTYSGDTNFKSGVTTTPLTQIVGKDGTTTTVSSAGSSVFGQTQTLTATLAAAAPGAGTPGGSVSFFDGGALLGTGTLSGGVATFSTSKLSVGNHTITARYSGDGNFLTSTSANFTQTVLPANTTITVAASRNLVLAGRPVGFTATVSVVAPGAGAPTGSVSFFDGSTLIGTAALQGNQATLITSFTAGSHSISTSYSGDGSFNPSTSTTPVIVSVATQNQAFIAQVYLDLLNRPVDTVGLTGWTAKLDAGMSRVSVVSQIETTMEYHQIEVNNLYLKYLRRSADAIGTASFTSFLAGGGTVEQVASLLIGSTEYYNRFGGGTNTGWLNAVAKDVLGHVLAPRDQQVLLLLLQQFTPRNSVAMLILRGTEGETDLISTYYTLYLHRPADAPGVAAWVNAVLNGGLHQEDVISRIVGGDEYFSRL